jgi:hypothetical protein
MKKLFALVAISILISACQPRTVVVTPEYQTPLRPDLPKIRDSELSCINDDTYERLAKRDQSWRFHVEKLEKLLEPVK